MKEKTSNFSQNWKTSASAGCDSQLLKWQLFVPGSQGLAKTNLLIPVIKPPRRYRRKSRPASPLNHLKNGLKNYSNSKLKDTGLPDFPEQDNYAKTAVSNSIHFFPSFSSSSSPPPPPPLPPPPPPPSPSSASSPSPSSFCSTDITSFQCIGQKITAEPQINSLPLQPSYFPQSLPQPNRSELFTKNQEMPLVGQWRPQQEQLMHQPIIQQLQLFLQQQQLRLQLHLNLHLWHKHQQQQQLPPTQMFRGHSGFSDVAASENTFVLESSTVGQSVTSLTTLLAASGLNFVGPSWSEMYPSPSKLLHQLDDSLVRSTSSR